jgi:hypothetical protein
LRAAHHLLHGDLAAAFRLNPLFVSAVPILLLAAIGQVVKRRTGRDWLRPFRRPVWGWLAVAALVVFGLLRNLSDGPFSRLSL